MNGVWRPSRLSRAQQEERRLEGQRLLEGGEYTSSQIARHLGVQDSTVRHWAKKLRERGRDALKARLSGGRPRQLTVEQEQRLCKIIDAGAVKAGFPNEQWTSPRVRHVIGQQFGVWYHEDHVYKLLIRLGFSVQKPDKRAVERDEEAIQTWVRTRGVELGKKDRGGRDRGVSGRERLQPQDDDRQDVGT